MAHGEIQSGKSRLTIIVPDDLKEWIIAKAESENRTMSNYVLALLTRERKEDQFQ